jgi:hypothetical protein
MFAARDHPHISRRIEPTLEPRVENDRSPHRAWLSTQSARQLASWAGLTPTVRGSDRVACNGHISKEGSVWLLRWVLSEAAQTAKRHPDFAASATPPSGGLHHRVAFNERAPLFTSAPKPAHRGQSAQVIGARGSGV